MGEFADKMGIKNPGDLILSSDWNNVVSEIDTINGNVATVDSKAEANNTAIHALETRISKAEADLQSLLSAIDTLRGRFRRITLNTDRHRFAFGETGVITATVTAVDGSPVDFSDSGRPWIDFVTVWGRLSAADGYATTGGEGGRTVSVQVDEHGVAKVNIHAESATGATQEEESAAYGVLQTVNDEGITFAEKIISANTPQDTGLEQYYKTVNQMYDNSPEKHFTRYVDKYCQRSMYQVQPEYSIADWYINDYRTTVMAFVKGDNNPVTAEPSLGTAAIQVTFRDWLYPWLVLGFMATYVELVDVYVEAMQAVEAETYAEAVASMQKQVEDIIKDKGKAGRQRDYMAMEEALTKIIAGDNPAYVEKVARNARDGIRVQKEMDMTSGGGMDTFLALTSMDARNMEQVEKVQHDAADLLEQEMEKARTEIFNGVRAEQQEFKEEIFSETNPVALPALHRKIQALDNQVSGLVVLDPASVTSGLDKVAGVEHRLMVLESKVEGRQPG